MLKKIQAAVLVFFVLSSGLSLRCLAQSGGENTEESGEEFIMDALDLSHIEEFLRHDGETFSFTFQELIGQLMSGNFKDAFYSCAGAVKESLFSEIEQNGSWALQVIILGLVGALFANFAGIFSGSQISETGFYVTYLLIFTLLAASFLNGVEIVENLLERVIEFMRALVPTFFLAVSFAGGSVSSAAGYGWMLLSINGVQWFFLKVLLPASQICVLLNLTGYLLKEDLFSRTTGFLDQAIRWSLKTFVGIVLGFHMLQGLVTPYADSLKGLSLRRAVSMVPGIGQGAEAVSQVIMGTGVLIKNTIGAGAVIVLFIIALIPLLKLVLLYLFCQGAAAVLQPVCDKRIVNCISSVGTGFGLLLSVACGTLLLFSLSLAVVCMAANVSYFSG